MLIFKKGMVQCGLGMMIYFEYYFSTNFYIKYLTFIVQQTFLLFSATAVVTISFSLKDKKGLYQLYVTEIFKKKLANAIV
jgi:hypothetical protein